MSFPHKLQKKGAGKGSLHEVQQIKLDCEIQICLFSEPRKLFVSISSSQRWESKIPPPHMVQYIGAGKSMPHLKHLFLVSKGRQTW